MTIDDLSFAQRYARKVLRLAVLDALIETEQDSKMSVIDARIKTDTWLLDLEEEQLIEYASEIDQGRALLNYDRYAETFELYDK